MNQIFLLYGQLLANTGCPQVICGPVLAATSYCWLHNSTDSLTYTHSHTLHWYAQEGSGHTPAWEWTLWLPHLALPYPSMILSALSWFHPNTKVGSGPSRTHTQTHRHTHTHTHTQQQQKHRRVRRALQPPPSALSCATGGSWTRSTRVWRAVSALFPSPKKDRKHTHTQTHTHRHTCMHTHRNRKTHAHTLRPTQKRIRKHTYTNTHTLTEQWGWLVDCNFTPRAGAILEHVPFPS